MNLTYLRYWRKKKMTTTKYSRYSGIQTVFKKAGESGCLFLSLLSIVEDYTRLPVDFIHAYNKCIGMGIIDEDFYCQDQEKMLETFTGKKWKKTVVKELPSIVPLEMYTVAKWYNERTKFTHFRRRGWDTLNNSVTVKEGKIVEYYCYTVQEK